MTTLLNDPDAILTAVIHLDARVQLRLALPCCHLSHQGHLDPGPTEPQVSHILPSFKHLYSPFTLLATLHGD